MLSIVLSAGDAEMKETLLAFPRGHTLVKGTRNPRALQYIVIHVVREVSTGQLRSIQKKKKRPLNRVLQAS